MDIDNKMNSALAQLQAMQINRPSSGDEGEVSQFHEIVDALEEAFKVDLTSYRIQDADLKQYEDESGSTSWVDAGRHVDRFSLAPASKQMSAKRYCDVHLLQRKIDGVALYIQTLIQTPERKKIGFQ
jgi:hypothetical protein